MKLMWVARLAAVTALASATVFALATRGTPTLWASLNASGSVSLSCYQVSESADVTSDFSIPAGDDDIEQPVIMFTPQEWGVARDADVPDGATVGQLDSLITLGLMGGPCNTQLSVSYVLRDVTTGGDATLRARYHGEASAAGTQVSVDVLVFEPGTEFPSDLGYPSVIVHEPAWEPQPGGMVTSFCSPAREKLTTTGTGLRTNPVHDGIYTFRIRSGGTSLEMPIEVEGLIAGDLLLGLGTKIVPGFWSHVGMYVGECQIVEARAAGVAACSLEDWKSRYKTRAALRVVTADDEIRRRAVEFASDKLGEPYDWMWWQKDPNGEAWYCSELVWAAYLHASDGQINIEYHRPWEILEGGITPDEILLDEETEVIADEYGNTPQRGFVVQAKSPVDLELVDPQALSLNKQLIEVAGGVYGEDDIDGNGSLEDWIGLPERKMGEYLISVVPEPGASPEDTYTLEVTLEDNTTIVLAQNVQISDIPSDPYVFESVMTPVGGIAELPGVAGGADWSARTHGFLASALAVAAVALTAGAWYARRRLS